ncbi:MAG: lytic transglycosylase domain-containing protein [Thermodesulfobacteriota bacterium]
MRDLLRILGPCLILPVLLFVLLAYPRLSSDIEQRSRLLCIYDISKQFSDEIAHANAPGQDVPPRYASLIADYEQVTARPEFRDWETISATARTFSFPERLLARIILWRRNLSPQLLEGDPAGELVRNLENLREKEAKLVRERQYLVEGSVLHYLKYRAPQPSQPLPLKKGLPPEILASGLVFCGEPIPLNREDVRNRIEYQIEHLLTDLRYTTGLWLKRQDRYADVVGKILEAEGVPLEFALLPALESGYSGAVVSPSMAKGWWQFVRVTAVTSRAQDPDLDWRLRVDKWLDQRSDLVVSTRAAARHLKWLRSRLSGPSSSASWLTVAAAYNAGLNEIGYRTGAYQTNQYWDMKLPVETEDYVPRWIAFALINANRKWYDLSVTPVATLQIDTLEDLWLKQDLPLSVIAGLTGASVRFLKEINGALPRNQSVFKASTETGYAHTIHVPRGWKMKVLQELEERAYVKGTKPPENQTQPKKSKAPSDNASSAGRSAA